MLLEAEPTPGVVTVPLSKYAGFNTRICRPLGLSDADRRKVIDYALARLGMQYDGKQIIDRLDEIDSSGRFYRYTSLSGIPASNCTWTLGVKPKGDGSVVEWRSQFLPDNQPDIVVKAIVSALLKTGLGSLRQRFGAAR